LEGPPPRRWNRHNGVDLKVPGFVRPYWRRRRRRLSAASTRSICRALMVRNWASTAGDNARRFRAQGSHCGSSAFNRTDHGYPAATQTAFNARTAAGA
jgi:hypothetical protein